MAAADVPEHVAGGSASTATAEPAGGDGDGDGGSAAATAPAGDASDSSRKAALEARMKARGQAREDEANARRAKGLETKDPSENAHKFWREFQSDRTALEDEITGYMEGRGGKMATTSVDSKAATALIDGWTQRVRTLHARVADATLYLPPYDVRQAQGALDTVSAKIEETRQAVVPRKRFAFNRSRRKEQEAKRAAEAAGASGADGGSDDAGTGAGTGASKDDGGAESKEASWAKFDVEEKSFEDASGKELVLAPGELGTDGGNFKLSNLQDCVVVLTDVLRALRIDRLTRCHVYAGAVSGSVLLDGCTDCTFVLSSRQIRIHTSTRCDYYLHVLSHPIIEHCTALRFAPSGLDYPLLSAQREAAGLVAERATTMWANVDDFGWHRAHKSPNWSVVPAGERLAAAKSDKVKITVVGGGDVGDSSGAGAGAADAAVGVSTAATAAAGDDDDDDDEL